MMHGCCCHKAYSFSIIPSYSIISFVPSSSLHIKQDVFTNMLEYRIIPGDQDNLVDHEYLDRQFYPTQYCS